MRCISLLQRSGSAPRKKTGSHASAPLIRRHTHALEHSVSVIKKHYQWVDASTAIQEFEGRRAITRDIKVTEAVFS